ncbi:MAG: hypothetical protein AUH85_14070 [Chloroflexi bacterium 13_1_40CM_4_68_4]|nr:MAG: hypothetical protein AUH85_14070 [Chloroflexi bacterium 13_1_40CM_4_68_4]
MAVAPLAWIVLLVVAGALALRALLLWLFALAANGPVMYGEGAVAHAGSIIARGGDPYGPARAGMFVAANYSPLAYLVAAMGESIGPFFALRFASIIATLSVAVAIAWRARHQRLQAIALGASFLALVPVEVWGPAHRSDPLAIALTALAILAAAPSWWRAGIAGASASLAVYAKPTSVLPLAVVFAYLLWRERDVAVRTIGAAVIAAVALGAFSLARFDAAGLVDHVVRRNQLPLDFGQLPSLLIACLITIGVFIVAGLRTSDGRLRAYVAGGALVLLLGAREGATINYFLDLAVASCLGVVTVAARTQNPLLPLALAAQLVLGAVFFRPLDASATTGAWSDPRRAALASDLARTSPHLAEESGVLVANGIDPIVDDLFLWSRLVAIGAIVDDVTPRILDGEFATVIAEVSLEGLDRAPAFERQRWPPTLARAVLTAYRLDVSADHFYKYVPRRILVRLE